MLTKTPRFLGLDGRKMSKSYQNYIALSEDDQGIERKVLSMFTDPARKRRNDPGHPDVCNVFDYYSIFKPEYKDELKDACINAKIGCRECKQALAKILREFIAPHRQKKKEILKKKNYIKDVLEEGRKKAKESASKTLGEVKKALKL